MYKRNQVFAAACIGLLLFGIMLITVGSILPSITEKFKSSGIKTGSLTWISPIGILLGSLIFGPIVDRFGYKTLLIVTTLLLIPAFQGLAFGNSFFVLQLSSFIIGIGGGILNGATNAVVSDISTGDKGASLSLLGAFFGFGALGMPLLLGALLKHFNYSIILSCVGFSFLLAVIYFLLIKFPVPKHTQGFPLSAGMKLLKEPAILLIGFFLFFQSGTEALVNNWSTSFLQNEMKFSEQGSLFLLTIYMVALTVARLILGGILRKISSYLLMLLSLFLFLVGVVILQFAQTYSVSLIAFIIIGLGLAAAFPVMLGYVGHLYSTLSGTAFSIVLVIGLIGNILINYLFDLISHQQGFALLPWLLMASVVFRLIFLLLVKKKIHLHIKL
jgi:MFS family permease